MRSRGGVGALAAATLAGLAAASSGERSVVGWAPVSIGVVTWNLGERSPPARDCQFLKRLAATQDVVIVGCQEVEEVKPRRVEGRRSRYLYALVRRVLSKKLGFGKLWRVQLGGVQLLVASKRKCSLAGSMSIACGVGNLVPNKGGVGVFLDIDGARLAAVSAHLAAHAEKVAERNADYRRIAGELVATSPWGDPGAVIFCGDLNYRLHGLTRAEVEVALALDSDLLFDGFDQLSRERGARRAFVGFVEGRPRFDPTFKYDRKTQTFDTSPKRRVPAWTDRVLFTPSGLDLLDYFSVPDAAHSDHRPVVATFTLRRPEPLAPRRSRRSRRSRRRDDLPTLPALPDDDDDDHHHHAL